MTRFSTFRLLRHSFMRGIVGRIFLQSFFVALLVEAVFLAEKFSSVFNQGVNNHAPLSDIFLLLFLTSPEIFDVALAIAILIGCYRAVLRAREDRELLVMAGAGMGAAQLIGLLLVVALLAQAASLFVSGAVGPRAQYAQRVILFDAQYRALREGGTTGQFYEFPNHVVYAGPRTDGTDRRLFIKQTMGNTNRVITADKATLAGPDNTGQMALQLRDFLAYDFETPSGNASPEAQSLCPGCPAIPDSAPGVTMRIRNFTQQFQLDDLMKFAPRGTEMAGEWTLLELLGVLPPPAPLGSLETKSLGERFARSLLCLIAPLLAGLAVAFTTRATNTFALPLACLTLLGLDLLSSALVAAATPLGNALLLEILFAVAAALILSLIIWVSRAQRALVRPALGRP